MSNLGILFRHILPNVIGPIILSASFGLGAVAGTEVFLSFLGLGVPLNIPTWGNILNVAQDILVLQNYWWMWGPVGIVISVFVLCVNFIGDGFRDSTDPSQQG